MPLSHQHSFIAELDTIHHAMDSELDAQTLKLLQQAQALEKWPIAQLVSLFERNTTDCLIKRHLISRYIHQHCAQFKKSATVFGFTGTPGAGKSSLIGEVCLNLLAQNDALSIAVLAIDPSSQSSGGALLGDRTRTTFPVNDKRIFFRSQASHQDLGGMGKTTFHALRLLRKLFDIVIIETVGIGQSEIEVQRLSDHTLLVMQPLAGDQVQFMKAGIMEVPDTFVINKCDEDTLARKSKHLLQSSLKLAQIYGPDESHASQAIFMTSATKHKGIDALCEHLLSTMQSTPASPPEEQETYFLNKWIKEAYGEFGMHLADHFAQTQAVVRGTFEEKEVAFKTLMANFLTNLG